MTGLPIEHQGRELLHGIDLLVHCLRIPNGTAANRRRWTHQMRKASARLETLYRAGLDRNFCRMATTRAHAE